MKDMTTGLLMEELQCMIKDDDVLPMSKYGRAKWALLEDEEVLDGKPVVDKEGHDNR